MQAEQRAQQSRVLDLGLSPGAGVANARDAAPRQFDSPPVIPAGLEDRAARTLSSMPRPFLRWPGSKRRLLRQILPHLPPNFQHYWEPFLGGGSLLFLLRPPASTVADLCRPLITTFAAVRDGPNAVTESLRPWPVDRASFYKIRGLSPTNRFEAAAKFIYLNKTCWNGLYRVNGSGHFNVPFGRPKSASVVDASNIVACSAYLRSGRPRMLVADFEDALVGVKAGDFVFLDPPYVSKHNNNGFVDYNETLFSWEDQRRLAALADRLVTQGALVYITNALHRDVLDLYPNFLVCALSRHSTLASSADRRGPVAEALLIPRGTPLLRNERK